MASNSMDDFITYSSIHITKINNKLFLIVHVYNGIFLFLINETMTIEIFDKFTSIKSIIIAGKKKIYNNLQVLEIKLWYI